KDGNNVLKWTTEDEAGSGEYIVERSKDANNFREVGRVSSKGNVINHYQWSEKFIPGKSYYRLAIVDAQGKLNYSKIVLVETDKNKFKVYPNPSLNGIFHISLNEEKEIKIYNTIGILVLRKKFNAGIHMLELSRYGKGIYIVEGDEEKMLISY
ncbi:MAG: T9SS type A sorting domain-containing protein, partial [Heyndrickxia sp.]